MFGVMETFGDFLSFNIHVSCAELGYPTTKKVILIFRPRKHSVQRVNHDYTYAFANNDLQVLIGSSYGLFWGLVSLWLGGRNIKYFTHLCY